MSLVRRARKAIAEFDRAETSAFRVAGLLPALADRCERLEQALREACEIGNLLSDAAERDGDMSDEEVSEYRARGSARLAALAAELEDK